MATATLLAPPSGTVLEGGAAPLLRTAVQPADPPGAPRRARRWRAELAGRRQRFLLDDARCSRDVSAARTLADLPLGGLRAADRPAPVALSAGAADRFVDRLRRGADAAAAELAQRTAAVRPGGGDPAAALHHLLTRHRFGKGPRGFVDPARQRRVVAEFTTAGAPVPVVLGGFPFKQRDNGLKVAGPEPDLAELGALVRLRELAEAVRRVYAPGVRFTVLADGGYYRPRDRADIRAYQAGLREFAARLGLEDRLTVRQRSDVLGDRPQQAGPVAHARSVDRWVQRVRDVAEGPLRDLDPWGVDDALRRSARVELPAGTTFASIFRAMVFSVPVPRADRADPARTCPLWSQLVLADLFEVPTADPDLAAARRAVLTTALTDAVQYVATVLADQEHLVDERLGPHVRLSTVVSRPDCYGFSYLGGSSVLPWHGTGCLDARGRVGTDFLAALVHRGFVPVRAQLVGGGQPFMMVPGDAVTPRGTLDEAWLAGARLRSR